MKHSSELYERSSTTSITVYSDETEKAIWKCKVCGASVTVHLGTETPKDIKHVVSELECLKKFLTEDKQQPAGDCPKEGTHQPVESWFYALEGSYYVCEKCGTRLGG